MTEQGATPSNVNDILTSTYESNATSIMKYKQRVDHFITVPWA